MFLCILLFLSSFPFVQYTADRVNENNHQNEKQYQVPTPQESTQPAVKKVCYGKRRGSRMGMGYGAWALNFSLPGGIPC